MSDRRIITDDELLNIEKDGHKYEVVDGELVATQVDMMHEMVIPAVAVAVGQFDVRFIGADGELDGEDVLPGFRCALADLFA